MSKNLFLVLLGFLVFSTASNSVQAKSQINFDITNHGVIILLTEPGERLVEFFNKYRPQANSEAESVFAEALKPLAWLFEGCYKYEFLSTVNNIEKNGSNDQNMHLNKKLANITNEYFSEIFDQLKDISSLSKAPDAKSFTLNFEQIQAKLNKASQIYQGDLKTGFITSIQYPYEAKLANQLSSAIEHEGLIIDEGFRFAAYRLCAENYDEKTCSNIKSNFKYPEKGSAVGLQEFPGIFVSYFHVWVEFIKGMTN